MRAALVAAARRMGDLGLSRGTSGNLSARVDDAFLITPSAVPPDEMEPDDVVVMTLDGSATGRRAPSTEWRIHRDVLVARPEVGAIVHAHPPFATALACLHREIPPFHYMVAVAGGPTIRCSPYARFGTQELSDHALAALADREACLLGNHGMLVVGPALDAAMAMAVEVEGLAEMFWLALQAGDPVLLDDRQMGEALAAFGEYRS